MEEEDESELVAWAEEEDLTTDQDRIPEEVRFALALYASYASVLDRWLGRLLRSVNESPEWREGVVVFTAAMGQAVFEPPGSPRAGELVPEEAPPPCRGEVLQTPLIVRLPGGASARVGAEAGEGTGKGTVVVPGPNGNVVTQRGTRRRGLVSTIDLGPTLGEWFGVAALPQWQGRSVWPLIRQEVEAIHDEVLTTLPTGGWALRTPEYLLVEEPEQGDAGEEQPGERSRERGEQMTRLYEKPVDRWDVADVARQQPGVVDELRQWLGRRREELQQAGESGA
jgi:arylsulfatase A-like enzyme